MAPKQKPRSVRGLRGTGGWLACLRTAGGGHKRAGHPVPYAGCVPPARGCAENSYKKPEGHKAFGGADSQADGAQTMLRVCQPSPIRTIPSAPAFHRILLASRRARGLEDSVSVLNSLPPIGNYLTHGEIHPAPKVSVQSYSTIGIIFDCDRNVKLDRNRLGATPRGASLRTFLSALHLWLAEQTRSIPRQRVGQVAGHAAAAASQV
jgi:hypothetical protein